MKISYNWLQSYFEKPIPAPEEIQDLLTMHSFEVEAIEKKSTDFVLDIKVLPNRAHDCLSHRGIAGEVSILTGILLKKEFLSQKEFSIPESNVLRIEIEDQKLCKRFSALVIENIEVKESPAWLRDRLEAIGQRSINNIVDATNYVMFSTGQPLHAYDSALLKNLDGGYKVIARKANEGEKVKALGDAEYILNSENLVISDGNSGEALGIAAVKGGVATKISEHTKNIILESANFESVNIRKTAKQLGLRTDASVRFENEITPELTTEALSHVLDLILEIAQTESTRVEGLVDVYPQPEKWVYKIGVSVGEVNDLLGTHMKEKELEKVLNQMQFSFEYISQIEYIQEKIPEVVGKKYKRPSSMRFDAPEFFSCSSLISYLYSSVWMPSLAIDKYAFSLPIKKEDLKYGDLVFSNGGNGKIYYETIEYLSGTKVISGIDHVGIFVGDGKVLHASIGTNNVTIESIEESQSFKNIVGYGRILANIEEKRFVVSIPKERLDLRIPVDLIEEIGRVYGYENVSPTSIQAKKASEINKNAYYEDITRNTLAEKGFSEVLTYAFTNEGEVELQNPLASDKGYLRKSLVSGLKKSLNLNIVNADLLGLTQIKIFEIGRVFEKGEEYTSLGIVIKNTKSYKGKKEEDEIKETIELLEKTFDAKIKIKVEEEIVQIDLEKVIKNLLEPTNHLSYNHNDSKFRYKQFSSYPFVLRDIAVFVPSNIKSTELFDVIKKESGDLLTNTQLFDEFKKEGKTSYAYRLVFQSKEKTLTDNEVNVIMEKVVGAITNKGWQVR